MSFRDPSSYFSQNSHSFNNANIRFTVNDQRSQILSWLSPLEPQTRHQDIRTRRLDGIGEWLLEGPEFQAWYSGGEDSPVLLCSGDPGTGKTYISSLVIDTLCDRNAGNSVGIACFYCDHLHQKDHAATSMVGGLLKQLLLASREIPEAIYQAFLKSGDQLGRRGLRLPELIELFRAVLPSFDRTFICIDALDECLVERRIELLRSLRKIMQNSKGTRLFLTGRPHIPEEVKKHLAIPAFVLNVQPNQNDITRYLAQKLDDDPDPDVMDDNLRAEIMLTIPRAFSKIFLLVALQIEMILGETTISGRREKLRQMGNDLGDAYAATLHRIKEQRGDRPRLGMAVLMWISLAERSLSVGELCHALGVKIGQSTSTDLDRENIPLIQTLLGCCLGLVTVDEKTSTVRLLHATLQEYLRSHAELFPNAHATMAEACLRYLNFESVQNIPPRFTDDILSELPFVEYASCYWGVHAKKEFTGPVKSLALELLENYPNHIASTLLFSHFNMKYTPQDMFLYRNRYKFTALHCVAAFGISELLEAIDIAGVNEKDGRGRIPLTYAAAEGHKQILGLFLKQTGVKINSQDVFGQTSLHWAVSSGSWGVVRLLIDRKDLDPNLADRDNQTALHLAAHNGNKGIAKILLGRDGLKANIRDVRALMPLCCAAASGHEEVVKLLLDREDVDPNVMDYYRQTPLFRASIRGHEGAVKVLLERKDVNPNMANNQEQTSLYWAARNSHPGVVELLLHRKDLDPNIANTSGQTALFQAVMDGRTDIVKLLLGRNDVKSNVCDSDNKTPLYRAARGGYEEIVKQLVCRRDTNPNTADRSNRTPLCWAAKKGYAGIVKLLLRSNGINPDIAEDGSQTPLYWASWGGHEDIVKLLLDREDVDPNTTDLNNQTPLFRATANEHERVVRLLLSKSSVKPNLADLKNQVPLHLAVEKGNDRLVQLFLDRSDVNPNLSDNDHQTALCRAAESGHVGLVKLLLSREDIIPNPTDMNGRSPLYRATLQAHEEIVKLLLDRNDVGPNIALKSGQTPLHISAREGYQGIVKLLLDREDIEPNRLNGQSQTPLYWAVRNSREEIARLLLSKPKVDPNPADETDQTPLHWASRTGNEGIFKMLLAREDITLNPVNRSGETPRSYAISYEHDGILKLLEDRLSRVEEDYH